MIGTPWELASNVSEKIEGRLKKRVELFEVPAAAAAARKKARSLTQNQLILLVTFLVFFCP